MIPSDAQPPEEGSYLDAGLFFRGRELGWSKFVYRDAGALMADEWIRIKARSNNGIDLWGCDWFSEAFIHGFLERCYDHGCLNAAIEVIWYYPCETANWGRSFREQTNDWIQDFMAKHAPLAERFLLALKKNPNLLVELADRLEKDQVVDGHPIWADSKDL